MVDLPRGTVTFLFTDVEGSTVRWERNQVAMRNAIEQHLTLLTSAVNAHNGVLFKVTGDAVQAAFSTAPDAIAAALSAQEAMLSDDWSEIGGLPIRMALHAGEAIPDNRGDYLAAPLNRLSRLLSTGHGGQILLTQAVQQLCRGDLPQGASLQDLGEHRLRDLLEPERVFQLLHPTLPGTFPPLKTLDARPNNLPRQPTPLLGREQEVSEVVALLRREDVQLVTLTGPGGTGKTRLAVQIGAEVLDTFPDGVWFVDLAPLRDATLVVPTMASVVRLRDASETPLLDRLISVLHHRRSLLILDNCEQILAAAPDVAALVAGCPLLAILSTSREAWHLRAEREVPLAPLPIPEHGPTASIEAVAQNPSVALFAQRAAAANPRFVLTADAVPAVAAICRQLDGLPLAIELAAARTKLLPPTALLQRLERRLPLLTGGARDAPPRQRTLRDTMAWSHDLLTDAERALFRRLAVFAGGWTLEAAEAVANSDGTVDVLEGLASLVDKSLVRQGDALRGGPRFAMFETIREFGVEQLVASGEEGQTRERHAAWVLAFVEEAEPELFRAEQQAWWERLEHERPNVRAALAWFEQCGDAERALLLTAALGMFGVLRGYLREGQDWLRRALAIPGESSATTRAWALFWNGHLGWFRGDYDAARVLMEQSLAVARASAFALGIAVSQYGLAMTAWTQGDLPRCLALGEEAILRYREVGELFYLAAALANFGTAALQYGDRERGEAWIAEGMALLYDLGNWWHIANFLSDHGIVAHSRGDLAEAAQHYRESARLFRELGDTWYVASPLAGLAAIAVTRGQSEAAARLLGVASALSEASGYAAWPWERERDEQTTAVARAALGEEHYARAVADGRRLPVEQAVAEAIEIADIVMGGEVAVHG